MNNTTKYHFDNQYLHCRSRKSIDIFLRDHIAALASGLLCIEKGKASRQRQCYTSIPVSLVYIYILLSSTHMHYDCNICFYVYKCYSKNLLN